MSHFTQEQGEEVIRLLTLLVVSKGLGEQKATDAPVHSGHKGGDFLKKTKMEFEVRFGESGLDWESFQRWITTTFKFAGQLDKKASTATAEDVIWAHKALSTSLSNGFAHLVDKKEE